MYTFSCTVNMAAMTRGHIRHPQTDIVDAFYKHKTESEVNVFDLLEGFFSFF